uniref:Lin-15A/B-like domain-containing protein n=1 Tax=Caenorhabditis japonica TaxID=281687 RepID=A0A8R1DFJ5_CAEJA
MTEPVDGDELSEFLATQYNEKLRVLLIQFFRELKLPYATVQNPHLHAIIRHLNPSISPPTFESLLEMGFANHDKFIGHELQQLHGRLLAKIGPIEKNDNLTNETLAENHFEYVEPAALPLDLDRLPSQNDYENLGNSELIPGYSNSPCVVCLRRMEWSRRRKLTKSEVTVFIYVCVAGRVYPLEIAQKVYKLRSSTCCVDHLKPVYTETLKLMGISHPDQMAIVKDGLIADAHTLINKIKDANYQEEPRSAILPIDRQKSCAPLRHTLNYFFKNYNKKINATFQKEATPPPPTTKRPKVSGNSSTTYQSPGSYKQSAFLTDFPEDFLEV